MRTKLSTCIRKVRYRTQSDALAACRKSNLDLRSYRCDRCGHFHLTSRIKGKRIPHPAPTCDAPLDGST